MDLMVDDHQNTKNDELWKDEKLGKLERKKLIFLRVIEES